MATTTTPHVSNNNNGGVTDLVARRVSLSRADDAVAVWKFQININLLCLFSSYWYSTCVMLFAMTFWRVAAVFWQKFFREVVHDGLVCKFWRNFIFWYILLCFGRITFSLHSFASFDRIWILFKIFCNSIYQLYIFNVKLLSVKIFGYLLQYWPHCALLRKMTKEGNLFW